MQMRCQNQCQTSSKCRLSRASNVLVRHRLLYWKGGGGGGGGGVQDPIDVGSTFDFVVHSAAAP